ncbi:cysteine-rich receptor-like protein kinase 3 [Quercus suber]|uniref:Cysteine-rich receptor-like protein kinase 3 n=1 Tax=Quercus suber TaxID=58331 RepID=A0AAW0KIG3_QUESU
MSKSNPTQSQLKNNNIRRRTGCENQGSLILVHVRQRKKERVLNAGCYMRYSTQKFYYNSRDPEGGDNHEKKQLGGLLSNLYKSKLNFPYESLESATNYFHNSKKLGEGRYGAVYKMTNFLTTM